MKLVFICAPYRAITKCGVAANISKASKLGIDVVNVLGKYDYFPVIAHANTGLFDVDSNVDADIRKNDVYWLAGTSKLLLQCDVMYCPYGGLDCTGGMVEELKLASDNGIPVYSSLITLVNQELRKIKRKTIGS